MRPQTSGQVLPDRGRAIPGRTSVMDWDKLRIFHAAAEAGSFTHAGELLRMSLSRR